VKQADLFQLWQFLNSLKLTTPNIGTATDIICCPGLDYCSLANAHSIGITAQLTKLLIAWTICMILVMLKSIFQAV
jgi:sulfite reductase (NADPH) hemoprotein beta-component